MPTGIPRSSVNTDAVQDLRPAEVQEATTIQLWAQMRDPLPRWEAAVEGLSQAPEPIPLSRVLRDQGRSLDGL